MASARVALVATGTLLVLLALVQGYQLDVRADEHSTGATIVDPSITLPLVASVICFLAARRAIPDTPGEPVPATRRRWWRRPGLILGTVGLLVLGGVAAWVAAHDPRSDVALDFWVDGRSAWHEEVAPNARWVTEEVCGVQFDCIEAVRADTVLLLRFADESDAYAAARSFAGEAWLSDYIVARFEPGQLTDEQRVAITLALDCVNTGLAPDGYEC